VGRLVVIEGLDGAGKHTLTERLYAAFAARGARVTPFAFPRYDADVHAELARDALHGRLGDLAGSVHGMAVLFALDRRAAAGELRGALAAARAAGRERDGRDRDSYETDAGLQERTAAVYAQLAERSWLSPWHVVDGAADVDADALAATLLG